MVAARATPQTAVIAEYLLEYGEGTVNEISEYTGILRSSVNPIVVRLMECSLLSRTDISEVGHPMYLYAVRDDNALAGLENLVSKYRVDKGSIPWTCARISI